MTSSRILFVDDDERILKGIVRQQGDDFDITTALGPMEALKLVNESEPFAVVVSDMRMPEMTGVDLLKRVREISPDTVRMILTGFAELNTTIQAVNEGHIFRFLSKPCDEDLMAASLEAGLKQYRLVVSEHELVQGTLRGSVKVLADVLSLVNPLAFGQSARVRTTVDGMLQRMEMDDKWQLEIAAMLSSLGCLTLPTELLNKKLHGEQLSRDESDQFSKHPDLARELISNIPRLEEVSEIIASQATGAEIRNDLLNQKAKVLQLAVAFDLHELTAETPLHALEQLKNSDHGFDAKLIEILSDFVKAEKNVQVMDVEIDDIEQGMVIADAVYHANGTLLMSKGQVITPSALRLLVNFSKNNSVAGSVKIVKTAVVCAAT